MKMQFKKAKREKAKARIGLTGPSGSGKTWGALQIAKGLGGSIAVIDTEHGSASLYEHLADFDVLNLEPPYTPERFIEAMQAAENAGYQILIIDSITHEWSGSGGCLEINEHLTKSKFKGNSYQAWAETGTRHRRFFDAILQSKMHIIATMRAKTETAMQESITGKKSVVKLGMKSEQRDGAEYELSLVFDIVHEGHYAVASKDRTSLFVDKDPQPITEETGRILKAWLESGVEPEPIKPPPVVERVAIDYDQLLENASTEVELNAIWQMLNKDKKIEMRERFTERKNEILNNSESEETANG